MQSLCEKPANRLCIVKRIYVIDREADHARIDREFGACILERYNVESDATRVFDAVKTLVDSGYFGHISWKRDVEGLRICRNNLLTNEFCPADALISDLTGEAAAAAAVEVHVWLYRPLYKTISLRGSSTGDCATTTYQCMEEVIPGTGI